MSAIFNQMIALQKLWEMFFLFHLKNFYRYRDIQVFFISAFLSFSPCQLLLSRLIQGNSQSLWHHWLSTKKQLHNILFDILGTKKMTLKLLSIDIWVLNNVSMETLSIDRVLHKESFLGKSCRKRAPINFREYPKQSLYARNCFNNKIFWMKITKKP